MSLLQPDSVIAELEDAVRSGSSEKRVNTLRQVTNLFLNEGERLSEDQIKVFDDVLCLLTARVETRAKAELGKRLAQVDYAPLEVIQRLALDDEIAVAEDVLVQSRRLTTSTLVEIASTKGQDHLFAISGRADLPAVVTDVIVDRGERRVIRKLAGNTSARVLGNRLCRNGGACRGRRRTHRNARASYRSPDQILARSAATGD